MRRAALVAWAVAAPAGADEYHYRDVDIGARAGGQAGAFVGQADDSSAAYYNPAGLALGEGSEISVSTSVYGFTTDSASIGSESFRSQQFVAFPSTFVVARHAPWVGEESSQRVALSILVTDYARLGRQVTTETTSRTSQLTDTTTQFGLSYGAGVLRRAALGGGAFLAYRTFDRFEAVADQAGASDFSLRRQEVAATHLGARAHLGALVDVARFLRIGAALRSPLLEVWRSAVVSTLTRDAGSEASGGETDEANFRSRQPFEAVLGVHVRPLSWLSAAADVALAAPVGRYLRLETLAVSEAVEKQTVVNVAAGAEARPVPNVPLRAGFFTNRSAQADLVGAVETSSLDGVAPDAIGFTGSIGYETGRAAVTLGVRYQTGSVESAVLDVTREVIVGAVTGSYRQ